MMPLLRSLLRLSVCLCVCLSVCNERELWVNRRLLQNLFTQRHLWWATDLARCEEKTTRKYSQPSSPEEGIKLAIFD